MPLLEQYVVERGGMSQQDAQAWAGDQRALGERGEFFFTVTQFCFTATRRSESGAHRSVGRLLTAGGEP